MRADIVPGARFPDYELTDHARTRRRLSEIQGNDPMILILSRGHYCPRDHQQHLELAAFYPKIAVSYTKIVTISTDNILETNEHRILWEHNGTSSRITRARYSKTWTYRNTQTRTTTR